jgi:hypothetical protein
MPALVRSASTSLKHSHAKFRALSAAAGLLFSYLVFSLLLPGEASALGLACHSSSAVVCSAHMLVLRLDLQDLKQLLHPADMQVSSSASQAL